MHVIASRTIHDFAERYPDAAPWLFTFLPRAEHAHWASIVDVRKVYPHADAVTAESGKTIIVFNACGNKYRLVTAIHFNRAKVYILHFMLHAVYDKPFWKKNL